MKSLEEHKKEQRELYLQMFRDDQERHDKLMRDLKIKWLPAFLFLLVCLYLTACATVPPAADKPADKVPDISAPSQPKPITDCAKNSWCWDQLTEDILRDKGKELLAMEPKDAADYAKNWKAADRGAFYKTLIMWISKRESGWDPNQTYKESFNDAKGNPVISTGLNQVSLESCHSYGSPAKSTEELKQPAMNIDCTVRILNRWSKDGYIARSLGAQSSTDKGNRGGARYWSTLRPGESKDFIKAKMKISF